jgi:hypothetical protein
VRWKEVVEEVVSWCRREVCWGRGLGMQAVRSKQLAVSAEASMRVHKPAI